MNWKMLFKLLIPLLAVLLLLFSGVAVVSSQPEDDNDDIPVILVNGTKIYLRSDESYSFYQGYSLQIKGINLENDRLWLELSLNGKSVKNDVVHEGSHFVYSRDSTVILNVTVDKVYSNPNGELVTFNPVYQYLDPQLETPKLNNTNNSTNSNNNSTSQNNTEDNSIDLNTPFVVAGMVVIGVLVIYILYKHTS